MTATGYAKLPQPYRRPDGRWTAQLSLGFVNGKRVRKTVYGATQRECRDKLIDALSAHRSNSLATLDERTTLSVILDRWLDSIGPSLRPRTRRNYADHVRLHIAPALGDVRVSKLTAADVQRFLNDRSAAGLSPKTVRHLRATLRTALQWAVDERLVVRNVAAGRHIRLPRLESSAINAMTPEQVRQVLAASAGDRLHALWVVAAYCGLRQGELLALRWSNLDGDMLSIDRSLQRIDGQLQLVPTKTARSVRTVALSPTVIAALAAHRTAQEAERKQPGYIDHGLIFATTIGTPIDPRNIIREWHRLTKRAGLPRFRFHDLRHTAATLMLAAGVDAITVAETLGHADRSMVMKVYGHVLPNQRDEAARRMEALLG